MVFELFFMMFFSIFLAFPSCYSAFTLFLVLESFGATQTFIVAFIRMIVPLVKFAAQNKIFMMIFTIFIFISNVHSLEISFALVNARDVISFLSIASAAPGFISFSGMPAKRRDAKTLANEGQEAVKKALDGFEYALEPYNPVKPSNIVFKAFKDLVKIDLLKNFDEDRSSIKMEEILRQIPTALVAIISYHGPLSEKRFWFGLNLDFDIEDSDGTINTYRMFLASPFLAEIGNHGSLTMAFLHSVRDYLKSEAPNKLCTFACRKNPLWSTNKILYNPKAYHYMKGMDKDKVALFKQDFEELFRCMLDNKGDKGVLANPKFLIET
jgi:hypothetical protein